MINDIEGNNNFLPLIDFTNPVIANISERA